MTDLEISKALALAIGWKNVPVIDGSVIVQTNNPHDKVLYNKNGYWIWNHRVFDYRDWNVIGPIAERYDAFPFYDKVRKHWTTWQGLWASADTPQKAIAMAVIQGGKK